MNAYHFRWRPPAPDGEPRVAIVTPRQADVFTNVCGGLSNIEIAERLFLAEDTVKTHVKAILQAMGASGRTHAVALAYSGAVTVIVRASEAVADAQRRHPAGRDLPEGAA